MGAVSGGPSAQGMPQSTSVRITSVIKRQKSLFVHQNFSNNLTQIHDIVTCSVECSSVELESNDGEDDDGEEKKQGDVDKRTNSLGNG